MTIPPVDIMFDFWINKIVMMQANLTNRAMISLLFGKYKFIEILEHFKKVFFCLRGDLASDLIEEIFSQTSMMNKFNINNISTLFKMFESEKLPEVKFKLSLKREESIDNDLTVLTPVNDNDEALRYLEREVHQRVASLASYRREGRQQILCNILYPCAGASAEKSAQPSLEIAQKY